MYNLSFATLKLSTSQNRQLYDDLLNIRSYQTAKFSNIALNVSSNNTYDDRANDGFDKKCYDLFWRS